MHRSFAGLLVLLAGCASAPPVHVPPPPNLMTPCEETLPLAEDGRSSTLLPLMVEWAELYHLCAARHAKLIEAVRGE